MCSGYHGNNKFLLIILAHFSIREYGVFTIFKDCNNKKTLNSFYTHVKYWFKISSSDITNNKLTVIQKAQSAFICWPASPCYTHVQIIHA